MATTQLQNNTGSAYFDYYNRIAGGIEEMRQISDGLQIIFHNGNRCNVGFPVAYELWNYVRYTYGIRGDRAVFPPPTNLCGTSTYNNYGYYGYYGYDTACGVSSSYVDSCRAYVKCDGTNYPEDKKKKDAKSKKSTVLKKLYWSYYQRHKTKPF